MTNEIVAINPKKKKGGKKKKPAPTKKDKTMAKKKRKKSKAITKRRKSNPSPKKLARRAGRRARMTLGGMKIGTALANTIPHVGGMMAAQWGAKKFSEGGGANDPNWEFRNYLTGGAAAFAAGFLAENLRRGYGQKVLEGGLALLGYKLLVNEVAPQSEWMMEQFGEEDEFEAVFGQDDEFIMMGETEEDEFEAVFGEDDEYTEGDAYLADDGETYVMGQDGRWYPVSESHRQISEDEEDEMLGGELVRPGRLGGELVRPGRLGEEAVYPPPGGGDPFQRAYDGRG